MRGTLGTLSQLTAALGYAAQGSNPELAGFARDHRDPHATALSSASRQVRYSLTRLSRALDRVLAGLLLVTLPLPLPLPLTLPLTGCSPACCS